MAAVVGALLAVLAGCTAATPSNTAEPTSIGVSSASPTAPDASPTASDASPTAPDCIADGARPRVGDCRRSADGDAERTRAEPTSIALSPAAPTAADTGPVAPVRVLQLNLCNSGFADCYTGRATAEAAAVIHEEIPDLVTVNEICQGDLPGLQQALAEVVPDGQVVSAFQGAHDRRTGDVYRCRNAEPYGIGLISRWPSVPGHTADSGIYPSQDTDDPEERAWLCLDVAASPAMTACTTHLADTKSEVAADQCRYLFGTVIAELHARDPVMPVVLGGDLNLGTGDSAPVKSCLPTDSVLADDGGVQLVVATPEFVVSSAGQIDLRGTTDHPGLLVTLSGRPGS